MYLKSLELHGFKSFPNRTTLHFERGTTIVVGPNGSGKSNISDAMRWVLGEISSRNIRGTKMEDVIFGGTDLRRPMSFAEVSVTFDNTDESHRIDSPYDEITVTRRYYRSGESEYQINRKNCRLRDIHDLFLNTGVGREGYSIIGQGKIAEILSRKSEDRRNIFEEAAGISRFRQKKEETEKKLTATVQNMDSVMLVFTELDNRIGSLAKDAEKAKRYRELLETKKGADVSLWLFDTQKIKVDLQAAEDAYKLALADYERLKENLETLEAQSDHLRDEQTGRRLASEQLHGKITETNKTIGILENKFQLALSTIRHLTEMIAQNEGRIADFDKEDDALRARQEESRAKIEELRKEEAGIKDDQLSVLVALEELSRNISALDDTLAEELRKIDEENQKAIDLRVRLNVSKQAKQEGAGKGESLKREVEKYRAEEEKLQKEVERCEGVTRTYKEKIDKAEEIITSSTRELEDLSVEEESKNRTLNELRAAADGLSERANALRRMEEHFEGYQQSVRYVMEEASRDPAAFRGKVYGPVSKLITIEEKYIVAIETALGASLQNIVVENEETAKSAIGVLKDAGAGRATFYPLTSIRSSGLTDEIREAKALPGYIGRGDELIDFDDRYRDVMEWLLQRTVVFDHLDHATEAAKKLHYKVKIVTLDGQVINAGGSFTGGSTRRDSGILSRSAEIEQLVKKAENARKQVENAEKEIVEIGKNKEKIRSRMKDAEQSRDLLYTMSRAQFSELDTANAKREANKTLLSTLCADLDRLTADSGRYDTDITTLETELATIDAGITALRDKRTEQDVERQKLLDERDAKNGEIADFKLRLSLNANDIANLESSIAADADAIEAHIADRELIRTQIASQKEQMASLEEENVANRQNVATLQSALSSLEEEQHGAEQDSDEFDRLEKELREKIRRETDDKEKSFAEYTRLENKLARLREDNERLENKLWEEYQITYEQAVELPYPPVTAQNRSEVASVQSSCRAKIRELGNVNVNAIEEYEEVRARHEMLKTQLDDLTAAKAELEEIMTNVEEEMRVNFRTTFDQINENFGTVFGELFGGGQAELSLTDPEDVLSSGIEIKAAPPGKIIKSLSLLSGGEQTFVAIALIFAILKANPTPFCIFDEIEAALDEVNVDRFGAYVQKYSAQTQFVLITHRRGTMEIGDRLYGVTMPERGISRAVPLDISEIESRQKELLS